MQWAWELGSVLPMKSVIQRVRALHALPEVRPGCIRRNSLNSPALIKKARADVPLLPACPWEHFDACFLLSAACLPFGTLRCLLALGQLGSILAPYMVSLNL